MILFTVYMVNFVDFKFKVADWWFKVGISSDKILNILRLAHRIYTHIEMLNWNGGYTTSLLLIWSLSSFTDFYAAGSRIVTWISEYPISTLENLFLWRMSNQGYLSAVLPVYKFWIQGKSISTKLILKILNKFPWYLFLYFFWVKYLETSALKENIFSPK